MGMFDRTKFKHDPSIDAAPRTVTTGDQDAPSLIDAGNACEDSGRIAEALELYNRAIELAPDLARAHLNRGNAELALGRAETAIASYEQALSIDRNYAAAYYNLGNAQRQLHRRDEALGSYRQAISLRPTFADCHVALGVVFQELGQGENAAASYTRALEINPEYAGAYCNLGNAFKSLGKPDEALQAYQQAVALAPGFADAHYNMGRLLHGSGNMDEAIASYRRTTELDADHSGAHHLLGDALAQIGRRDEAVESFSRAIAQDPSNYVALCSLGNVLRELGRRKEAVAKYRRSLSINPAFAVAHSNMGAALLELGDVQSAIKSYRRAIELDPNIAYPHYNLGNALRASGNLELAIDSFKRAVATDPKLAIAHYNLGNAYKDRARPAEAVASYRRALEITPRDAQVQNNLGNALQDLGQLEEAILAYRRALEIDPDLHLTVSNLLFCLSHMENMGTEALLQEHRQFAATFEQPLRNSWPRHENESNPTRTLQVGFVSADLREHAVAFFIEPLLDQLEKRSSLSLHAFANHGGEDDVSRRLRGKFAQWHNVESMSDAEMADTIQHHRIDVLIDLSGHTGGTRLRTFARKPAPIQASWMGYPGTTGLSSMDYYFADPFFLPPGQFDDQFTEKVVYLPATAPFLPYQFAPPINALPAVTNGYVTFGSFNRLSKVRQSAVSLWCAVLRTLPDAQMLLGAMPTGEYTGDVLHWFEDEGIDRKRLLLFQRSDMNAYLALHHHVDICLDTLPYAGGTTTNHALWMGVPTLTLVGKTPPSRQGAAMLGQVGLEDFVAENHDDFVARGVHWASNFAALATLRSGLRQRMAQSPVRRPEVIAAALERALRTMWRRWCDGQAPSSFEA